MMAKDWKTTIIGNVCKTNQQSYSLSEKWPFVNYLDTGNITEDHISEIQHVVTDHDTLPSRARRKVAIGDILFSTVRPNQRHYGMLKEVMPNMLVSTGFTVITANKKVVDNVFLYYYLAQDAIVNNLHAIAEQSVSAYPSIKSSDIERLEIVLPPLPEQITIGHILRALDDKIIVNSRINHHLEQIAQAIFNDWFIRFKECKRFTDVVQILGGGTPKTTTPEYWNGSIPFFTPKDISTTYILTTEKFLTKIGLDNCNSRLYPINTVFVTARGTVGKIALAGIPMAMNQSCYALIGNDGYGQYFIYHLVLRTLANLKNKASGAVFDAIVTRDFESETIFMPSTEEVSVFEEKVTPIYDAILNNSKESVRLAALRDTLLPRLMSGELRVSDIEPDK